MHSWVNILIFTNQHHRRVPSVIVAYYVLKIINERSEIWIRLITKSIRYGDIMIAKIIIIFLKKASSSLSQCPFDLPSTVFFFVFRESLQLLNNAVEVPKLILTSPSHILFLNFCNTFYQDWLSFVFLFLSGDESRSYMWYWVWIFNKFLLYKVDKDVKRLPLCLPYISSIFDGYQQFMMSGNQKDNVITFTTCFCNLHINLLNRFLSFPCTLYIWVVRVSPMLLWGSQMQDCAYLDHRR